MKKTALILTILLTCTACLEKDIRHDLYLYPDGSVDWTTMESNVRSTISDPAERDMEDSQYLMAAQRGEHSMALALESMGGRRVRSRIIRDERPFRVLTSAYFVSIEKMFRRMLDEAGIKNEVDLELGVLVEDPGTGAEILCDRLVIRIEEEETKEDDEEDPPVSEILFSLEEMQIVLVEGRFVAARGFEIHSRGDLATMEPDDGEQQDPEENESVYWLSWSLEG